MVHDLVVQGVHAPGGDGHVHQRHREHAHRVHDGDVNDAGREVQNGEGEGGERQQTHAHDGHAARAVAVEPLAGERIHDAHKDSAGHEHEARHRGRQPMERLHVNGHEDAGGQKRTLHEHADDGAHEEAAVLQHVDAQHRTRQTRLADEEPHNADDAERGGEQRHQREAGRAQGRETVEHKPEAQGGKGQRQRIEHRVALVRRRLVVHKEQRRNDNNDGQGEDEVEQNVPVGLVDDEARHRGADGRREGDNQAEDAHGRAAAINREHQHEHGHGHRHEDAGAGGLHETASQKHREVEAHGRQQRAHGKQAHREHEQLPRGEPILQKRRDGDHDGVHQREPGGQPLGRGLIDIHLGHDGRQCRRHQRLVQHRHKGAQHEHYQHHPLFAR